jgi:hypothetical protein
MRAQTKGKLKRRIRIAAASVMVAAGLISAVAAASAKNGIERPNGPKVPLRAMGEVGSDVSLDFSGAIDRQGAVTYAFGGKITQQAEAAEVRFPPGAFKSGRVFSKRAFGVGSTRACSEYRTVTLFRVEPNGTSTRVASTGTGQLSRGFGGPLARPLGEITGYYYAEVAPVTRHPGNYGGHRSPPGHGRLVYKIGGDPRDPKPSGGAYYRALTCLPARSPTIFVEVPAGLLNSK